MAKTYQAEGKQLAYGLRGLFTILALFLYLIFPKLHWGIFVGVFIIGLIAAEWIGATWAQERRARKKTYSSKSDRSKSTSTSKNAKSKQVDVKTAIKLTDTQLVNADIHSLSGIDFERLMEMYYKDQGYSVNESVVQGIMKYI